MMKDMKKIRLNPSSFSSYWWKSNLKTSAILVHFSKVLLLFQNCVEVISDHAKETSEPVNYA